MYKITKWSNNSVKVRLEGEKDRKRENREMPGSNAHLCLVPAFKSPSPGGLRRRGYIKLRLTCIAVWQKPTQLSSNFPPFKKEIQKSRSTCLWDAQSLPVLGQGRGFMQLFCHLCPLYSTSISFLCQSSETCIYKHSPFLFLRVLNDLH